MKQNSLDHQIKITLKFNQNEILHSASKNHNPSMMQIHKIVKEICGKITET